MRSELSSPETEGWQHWLVVRQSISTSGAKPPDQAFFLVFARTGTPRIEMAEALGGSFSSEQCFEVGQGEVGLDDNEVRSWHGWYRQVTLCLLAQAFLTILRIQSEGSETCHQEGKEEGKENGTEGTTPAPEQTQDQQEPSRANIDVPVMVPLTLPEVRQLFYYLIEVPPFSSLYHLAWSCWRRMHQATAQLSHYTRRIASLPHLQL